MRTLLVYDEELGSLFADCEAVCRAAVGLATGSDRYCSMVRPQWYSAQEQALRTRVQAVAGDAKTMSLPMTVPPPLETPFACHAHHHAPLPRSSHRDEEGRRERGSGRGAPETARGAGKLAQEDKSVPALLPPTTCEIEVCAVNGSIKALIGWYGVLPTHEENPYEP
jgi:hypothetical protein